jgi:hypothetical protein
MRYDCNLSCARESDVRSADPALLVDESGIDAVRGLAG